MSQRKPIYSDEERCQAISLLSYSLIPNLRCRNKQKIKINGIRYCKNHAAKYALNILIRNKQAEELS